MSGGRPEVLDAAITITKSVEMDVLGASQVTSKEAWHSLPIICQRMGGETSKSCQCNNAPRYVNAINANEDVVEM